MDEQSALENQRIYQECNLFILMEMWLMDSIPDANLNLLGFMTVRADRNTKACCSDLELLAISLHLYYLPREFSHVISLCVYPSES